MSSKLQFAAPADRAQAAAWRTCRAHAPAPRHVRRQHAASLPRAQLSGRSTFAFGQKWAAVQSRLVAVRATLPDSLPLDFEETAAEVKEALQGTSVYLVGMMGSGKSTVGKLVGRALQYNFFDTDSLIEQLTGSSIPDIFATDGEPAFRELETQVLHELAPFTECVVATGGGIVTRGENWGHMQHGLVVWLSGSPELLAARVVGDGTQSRPLLSQGEVGSTSEHAATVARLAGLLEERRSQYEFSDIVVPLEADEDEGGGPAGAPTGVVAYRVLDAIRRRIKADAELREERMNFEIVEDELPPTMRVMQSPVKQDPHLP